MSDIVYYVERLISIPAIGRKPPRRERWAVVSSSLTSDRDRAISMAKRLSEIWDAQTRVIREEQRPKDVIWTFPPKE